MKEDEGYYAGEEEAEKIEDIIKKHQKEENATDYEEDVQHAERVKEPRPLGTGEPIYLYIKSGVGTYTVVDTVFNSRIEASQFAEENFPNQKYKVMTEKDIENYMAKMQKRQERIDQTVESAKQVGREVVGGAKKVAGGFARASRDVAAHQGMTRETMEPRINRMWGAQPRRPPVQGPVVKEPQQPNINIQVGNRGVETKPPKEPEPEYEEEYEPRGQPYRRPTMRMQPPTKPMRFGQPPRQRMKINIPPGGGVFGQPRPIRGHPQQQGRINIPEGGGVFRPRGGMGGMPKARPHVITPYGVKPMGYRPPPRQEQPKKKSKKKRR